MRLLILTECSDEVGYGHVVRCSSLASEAQKRNIEVVFSIPNKVENHNFSFFNNNKVISSMWYELDNLRELINSCKPDLVLVDSYLASKECYSYLYDTVPSVIQIDDGFDFRYKGGIVINPSFNSKKNNYPLNEKEYTFLLGSQYVLLRQAFIEPNNKRILKEKIENVFIMIGGTDINGITNMLVTNIMDEIPDSEIHVVSQQGIDINRNVVHNYSNLNDKEIAHLMEICDFAIVGAGSTVYELVATRIPFLCIKVADNQEENIKMVETTGIGTSIRNLLDLEKALSKATKYTVRKQMLVNQKKFHLDGVSRIMDVALINSIQIEEASELNAREIYQLSVSPEIRKNSKNRELFSYENHLMWYENILKDKSSLLLIIKQNKTSLFLGQVRFQLINNSIIISISFTNDLKGKRISRLILKESLKLAKEKLGKHSLIAEIKKDNIPSVKLFESLGFELIEKKDDIIVLKNN